MNARLDENGNRVTEGDTNLYWSELRGSSKEYVFRIR